MTGEVGDSESAAFWLTQRLCRKLIKQLVSYVEKNTPVQPGVDRDLMLSMQQNSAFMRNVAGEPIRQVVDSKPELVHQVDLKFTPKKMNLFFVTSDDNQSQLGLSLRQVRQCLNILYRQYCQAEWTQDVWPDWVKETNIEKFQRAKSQKLH